MNQSHVRKLLKESGFSPEQLGTRVGISGMTLRRWGDLPAEDPIPSLYRKAFQEVVYELLAEGSLSKDSEVVKTVTSQSDGTIFNAAIKNLGFTPEFMENAKPNSESILEGLSQIGANAAKQESVDRSKRRILEYTKMGKDWKSRIRTLHEVIKSKQITSLDKFAAYGALFYLLTPFDLIPDHIPVFGLMDDFFILGIVAVYYTKRFPHLLKKSP